MSVKSDFCQTAKPGRVGDSTRSDLAFTSESTGTRTQGPRLKRDVHYLPRKMDFLRLNPFGFPPKNRQRRCPILQFATPRMPQQFPPYGISFFGLALNRRGDVRC